MMNMKVGGAGDNDGYTVKTVGRCTLVFGPVPMRDMARLMKQAPKKAVMDIGIAGRIGATLVFGLREDLDSLPLDELPINPTRLADAEVAKNAGLPKAVQDWLIYGERGLSSEAMCKAIWGMPASASDARYPLDVDDLKRCILMVDVTGALDRVQQAAGLSPEWREIMAVWDELYPAFKREFAEWNAAGKPAGFHSHRSSELLRAALERAAPVGQPVPMS